jgi:alkylation response protein AidB-like acyl-CoA dehydrogenase
VCLAANALLAAGSEAQKQEHLPGIATGETLAALAWTAPGGGPGAADVRATARRSGGDFVLSGRLRPVLDVHCAQLLVVAARNEGSSGVEGVELFAVPSATRGVACRALPTMDRTRRLGELELDAVRVPARARLECGSAAALERGLDLAAVALAAEQVGGAQRCLDLAVSYARERVQFGRPIGSFQAIQHKCADMMLRVESARSAAYTAGCVAAEGEAFELARLASLARVYCSEAYFQCAAETLQIHGGVGFTWEYDVHLYFKRARSSGILLGDPAWHRERLARLIGLADG